MHFIFSVNLVFLTSVVVTYTMTYIDSLRVITNVGHIGFDYYSSLSKQILLLFLQTYNPIIATMNVSMWKHISMEMNNRIQVHIPPPLAAGAVMSGAVGLLGQSSRPSMMQQM